MLQCDQQPAVVLAHPASLPLDRVLSRLSEATQSSAASGGKSQLYRAKLRITLGGGLCPPIAFKPPEGIKNWRELHLLNQSNAAQQIGTQATQTLCEWDDRQASLQAALPLAWMQGLQAWAKQEQAHIAAVNPVWAIATQSKLAKAATVRALYLQENDGITLLATPAPTPRPKRTPDGSHHTLQGVFLPKAPDTNADDAARHWLSDYGIAAPETLKLSFGELAQPTLQNAPRIWNNHWRQT
jgi:hypothetical protein